MNIVHENPSRNKRLSCSNEWVLRGNKSCDDGLSKMAGSQTWKRPDIHYDDFNLPRTWYFLCFGSPMTCAWQLTVALISNHPLSSCPESSRRPVDWHGLPNYLYTSTIRNQHCFTSGTQFRTKLTVSSTTGHERQGKKHNQIWKLQWFLD